MEVDQLLLAQLVCDTILALCEYLMAYSCLMVDIFLKRTRVELPTMAHAGRFRQKRISYSGFMYLKEWGFTGRSI